MRTLRHLIVATFFFVATALSSIAADQFVSFSRQDGGVLLISGGETVKIQVDENEHQGVLRAVGSLSEDILEVTGSTSMIGQFNDAKIIIGSLDKSTTIQQLAKKKIINLNDLKGKKEKYIIKTVGNQLIIAGSDLRGTEYGIYEFSKQIGISPWHWWADVPAEKHDRIYVANGTFTDGEPVVEYRGIFLNDEAPCLSGWVNEKFPDAECASADPNLAHGFNHHFYETLFELLLRLKANYLWPAMWGNAFYADDPMNSATAKEMGIIMGTSHHEPMARNHQEWARNRGANGPWDYDANPEVLDEFFRQGIRRAKDTEDLITIGMRGDGDAAMGGKVGHDDEFQTQDEYYIKLYERIFDAQRRIIQEETGRPASERPQMWAIYKEMQRYYDLGLRVPDDVLIMLCDDNWGNIRCVPGSSPEGTLEYDKAKLAARKGGYGMYYHVDYVGAPRNTKWANVTPIAHLWEQMNLCHQYGIDRLWILNVGDLKPMEYHIDLFLEMAWNPDKYSEAGSYLGHTREFCEVAFGKENADVTTRLMEQYLIYNGRVTPEMLSSRTYNLASGEFLQVVNEYKALEAEAQRAYYTQIGPEFRDAFYQLLLYPIQSMSNLYEMYYAQAMNHWCYERGIAEANDWATVVEKCFARDSYLTDQYHSLNGGKWNHLMDQKHIGYTSWQEPREQVVPAVYRLSDEQLRDGGFIFSSKNGYIAIEAEHYYSKAEAAKASWAVMPKYGRTKSAIALMPYTAACEGASVSYRVELPADVKDIKLHVITNSTLPYLRTKGHRYAVSVDGGAPVEVNYNGDYTEENVNLTFSVVATRVIETVTDLKLGKGDAVEESKVAHTVTVTPIDGGMVLEKLVVDYGGYERQHLFGTESSFRNENPNEIPQPARRFPPRQQ